MSDPGLLAPDPDGAAASDDGRPIGFACPRCGTEVQETFYGPCGTCRDQLRATLAADAVEVEAAAYEPKMNVTPNAVATKD